MRLFTIVLAISFLTLSVSAKNQTAEHVNSNILGQLVYNDVSVKLNREPSRDVMEEFKNGLDIMLAVYWQSDEGKGLDPEREITLQLKNQPALTVLERIVEQLDEDGNAAWQLRHGVLEIGLKERLASVGRQRLETYYIRDLLFTIHNFDAPNLGTFDDEESGGNAGSGTPNQSQQEEIDRLIELIVKFIEPDLWEQNGGPCSITNYKKTLLIKAPDFIHRQINGYPFLASRPENMRQRRVIYNKNGTNVIVDRLPLR